MKKAAEDGPAYSFDAGSGNADGNIASGGAYSFATPAPADEEPW